MFNDEDVWNEYIKTLKKRAPVSAEDLEEIGLSEVELEDLAADYGDDYDGNADDEEDDCLTHHPLP